MQTWIVRTTEQMDNDDNDQIAFQVDEETYAHDSWFDVDDWKYPDEELVDSTYNENGRLTRLIVQSFSQDFDRSAQAYYPVVRIRDLELREESPIA